MGLDMYLYKKIFVGGEFHGKEIKGGVDITIHKKKIKLKARKVSSIQTQVAYWRKANAIHKWFVDNVQDGNDNCAGYPVWKDKLAELVNLCREVLTNKRLAKKLLPRQDGFFFGSLKYNSDYFDDLKDTIEMLEKLPEGEYIYTSSW